MNRQIVDIDLKPAVGSRFQPTGFPDLGAAEYQAPAGDGTWVNALLVESAQSMANHLEAMAWNEAESAPESVVAGLPWVKVVAADDGRYITSSRVEAHRLASAFVKDSTTADGTDMVQFLAEAMGLRADTPHNRQEIATALFRLDPFCLLHGVFFADKRWPGQPKIARAVTGGIEALGVQPAHSGGVKHDNVRHSLSEGGGTSEGYGTVPFHRTEYTAQRITASFSIDTRQISSYGLSTQATQILKLLPQWQIQRLVNGGLRLRTACDLVPVDPNTLADRSGAVIAEEKLLADQITELASQCPELANVDNPILTVKWADQGKRKDKK